MTQKSRQFEENLSFIDPKTNLIVDSQSQYYERFFFSNFFRIFSVVFTHHYVVLNEIIYFYCRSIRAQITLTGLLDIFTICTQILKLFTEKFNEN